MENHQEWMLHIIDGIQDAILGPHLLYDAFLGLETVGAAQMKNLRLVDPPQPSVDGG